MANSNRIRKKKNRNNSDVERAIKKYAPTDKNKQSIETFSSGFDL